MTENLPPVMQRPQLRYGMTQDEMNQLVEWNRTRCHSRGCENRAVTTYAKRRANAHGGVSTFHYRRCRSHPVPDADGAVPIND
jgi:hypothetical protein